MDHLRAIVLREPAHSVPGKWSGAVSVGDGWELPGELMLFVAAGTGVPWDLADAGFGFLERFEVAAPQWRELLARDMGTHAERAATEAVVGDLRMPIYGHELLFVRATQDGRRFIETWRGECEDDQDQRLAFLRALFIVKPLFYALPGSWLIPADAMAKAWSVSAAEQPPPVSISHERARTRSAPAPALVHVEIAPGRYVCCLPDEVEKYKERFARMRTKRGV